MRPGGGVGFVVDFVLVYCLVELVVNCFMLCLFASQKVLDIGGYTVLNGHPFAVGC